MKEYHILNLGAGVQSTMLYLLAVEKHPVMPPLDCAIFADTGDEPQAVYAHLEWLKSLAGPPIIVCSKGVIGDDLMQGGSARTKGTARFAAIPAFTANGGMGKRECTMEYKVEVINQCIRRDIVGLVPRQRMPVHKVHVHQYLGLSFDEARRVIRVRHNMLKKAWTTPHFPLFETNTTRIGAKTWLEKRVPHTTPRSACVFCPYHSNTEWQAIHQGDPSNPDWQRACQIDDALRSDLYTNSKQMRHLQYLHRSLVPFRDADISTPEPHAEFEFVRECEGMCGV